jgi:hypothetical protein
MTRKSFVIAVLFGASLAGCGGTAAPTAAPEGEARAVLDQALGAWKEGKSPAALKEGSPSIVVGDPAWEKGAKLTRFEVEGPGKAAGAEQVYTVRLWVADAQGKESEQEVAYKVGTSPIRTVFRSLF